MDYTSIFTLMRAEVTLTAILVLVFLYDLVAGERGRRRFSAVVCGLLVVLIGLRMWGVPILRQLSPVPAKPCRFKGKALAVGLLTGLMPCGALSYMWMFAASSGSWKSGAAAMLAFGLGTCVFMLAFGLFGVFIPKRYNKYLVKCSTVLIVALGLILMTKGIKILL